MTAVATTSPIETDDQGVNALVAAPGADGPIVEAGLAPPPAALGSLRPGVRAGLIAAAAYVPAALMYWLVASWLWIGGHTAGIVVSDAVSWHRNFALVTAERPMVMARPGVVFFEFYKISPHINSLLNLVMMAASIVLTSTAVYAAVLAARRLDGGDAAMSSAPTARRPDVLVAARRSALVCGLLLGVTPWAWVITIGPTKEPFALLGAAATTLFCIRPQMTTAAVSIGALSLLALARVEQTVMFLAVMALAPVLRRVRQPRLLLVALGCAAVAFAVHLFAVGEALLGYQFFNLSPQLWPLKDTLVEGNEAAVGELGRRLGELGWYDPAWNAVAVIYRLAANIAGALLRMGVTTVDGMPSMLGVGQAIVGFVTVAGFVAAAARLRRADDRVNMSLVAQMMVIWIGASMVAFVQPRYVFVELPAALAVLAAASTMVRSRVLAACLAIALAGRIALWTAGLGVPPDQPLTGPPPPFLWASGEE